MSIQLPGKTITIAREQDRTWRVELFTELGTDYQIVIWRERVSYDENSNVIRTERGDIPATAQDGGKPARVSVRLSQLVGPIGRATEILSQAKSFNLSHIPGFIVDCNEVVAAADKERRRLRAVIQTLDTKLASKTITQQQYEQQLTTISAQLAQLIQTS